MTSLLLLSLLLARTDLFDVQSYPYEHPHAVCFVADMGGDREAELFVLDGQRLTLYENGLAEDPKVLDLPVGTSAVDVADITGDGLSDVVALQGEQVVRYSLEKGTWTLPAALFRLETIFSHGIHRPFLHVLVLKRAGTPLLGLPREDSFELRSADGRLLESYPIGMDAPHHVAYGHPFNCVSVDPPQTGPPDALEFRVTRVLAFKPSLPSDLLPVEMQNPAYRRATPRQAREAEGLEAESWPWFPLRKSGEESAKVLYALSGSGGDDSIVRIQQPAGEGTKNSSNGKLQTGPTRRYPGTLIITAEDLPDFNADGYVDLLLWKAKEPTPTVESLSKALMGETWPVSFSTHLYVPDNGRYASETASRITLNIPLGWLLGMGMEGPLRLTALRDFNGDGATDFGCLSAPNVYSAWCCGPKGFGAEPAFEYRFPETLQDLSLRADLSGQGKTSLVLRGEKHFYFLKTK